jgi:hypothetical protein
MRASNTPATTPLHDNTRARYGVVHSACLSNGIKMTSRPSPNDLWKAAADAIYHGVPKACGVCHSTRWEEKPDGFHCTGYVAPPLTRAQPLLYAALTHCYS